MPEMLTKYPESAFYVLQSAGAKCGVGMKQEILTICPADHFCALPLGEICVYDVKNFPAMTQMKPADLVNYVSDVPTIYSTFNFVLLMISCLFGVFVGIVLARK